MSTVEFIIQLIAQLGPAVAGVEQLIQSFIADFSETDKTKVQAALDAAKASDDAADAALNADN